MKLTEAILIVIVILLLLSRGCGKSSPKREVSLRVDTVYVKDKADTVYVPVPKYVKLPNRTTIDSFIAYEYIPVHDTVKVYGDYYTTYYFEDSVKTKYGNVVVKDTITQNRITGRRLVTDFEIPIITHTITQKPKRISFGVQGGYGLMYNQKQIINGPYVGVGLTFKF